MYRLRGFTVAFLRKSLDSWLVCSYFVSATNSTPVSKTLFIVPTDAHYYKIIETLNNLKL